MSAILRKIKESAETQERFFGAHADRIDECARALAAMFDAGGRLFCAGNGGSACDAQHVAVEFMHPIFEKRPPLPALALGSPALVTAIANDQDFALAFAHELRAHAKKGDALLAISTSGNSASVVRALRTAREMGLVTIGLGGRDGGKLPELCDFLFVVPSFSIHRIQEAHVAFLHLLWDAVHVARGEEDVTG